MEIKINFPEDNSHISNLAYIKALLIKSTIENLNISYEEKIKFKNEILEYLANTWKSVYQELKSHKKEEDLLWKNK